MSLFANRVPTDIEDPVVPPTGGAPQPRSTAGPAGLQRAMAVANPNALSHLQANAARVAGRDPSMAGQMAGQIGQGEQATGWLAQLLASLKNGGGAEAGGDLSGQALRAAMMGGVQ